MIRFACPGCGATYSVDDAKGGKTGKCPKCSAQFVIPMPEGGAAPPPDRPAAPPPPPANPGDPVEIAPCPGCQARLSVAPTDLGSDVECPYCKTVYKAAKPGTAQRQAVDRAPARRDDDRLSRRRDDDDDRPRRRDDEDDRPSRRARRDEDDDDRPSRRRRDDDYDDEDDRPRRRRRARDYEPHRGGLILTLGILSFVFCGIFTGLPAFLMGKSDLEKMDRGRMDPDGRGMTNAGRILGLVNVILTVVAFLGYCLIFVIAIAGGAAGR